MSYPQGFHHVFCKGHSITKQERLKKQGQHKMPGQAWHDREQLRDNKLNAKRHGSCPHEPFLHLKW
jgi:hypothetical protein